MDVVNLTQKLALFNDYWHPRIVGELNGQQVKLVKLKGEFVWHHHDAEDELFLVIKGRLLIRLPDRELWIGEGEFAIIPRGVEHCPVAQEVDGIVAPFPSGDHATVQVQDAIELEAVERDPVRRRRCGDIAGRSPVLARFGILRCVIHWASPVIAVT